jgi:hypothetical protein
MAFETTYQGKPAGKVLLSFSRKIVPGISWNEFKMIAQMVTMLLK